MITGDTLQVTGKFYFILIAIALSTFVTRQFQLDFLSSFFLFAVGYFRDIISILPSALHIRTLIDCLTFTSVNAIETNEKYLDEEENDKHNRIRFAEAAAAMRVSSVVRHA